MLKNFSINASVSLLSFVIVIYAEKRTLVKSNRK